jgi:hypothetical protein
MTTFAAKPGAPVAGEWHRPTALEGVAATGSRIMTARLTAQWPCF